MKLREVLTDESRWTRGSMARTKKGLPCSPRGESADSFCLLGAAVLCTDNLAELQELEKRLMAAVERHYGGPILVHRFNDSATFADIQAVMTMVDEEV